MRKNVYFKLGIMFFLLCICGCGHLHAQKAIQPEREELVLWSYYETEAQQQGLDVLMEKFNASQQQYRISWEYVPMSDFIKELTMAVSGNTLPDLILVDNPDMRSLVNTEMIEDLTDELEGMVSKEDYYDEVWTAVEYDDRVYGIPFCCNNTAIIYNKEMFRDAGIAPPKTWEEFAAAAEALTVGGADGHYGFVMSAASGEQGAFQFMPWLLATGADGQHLDDERTIEAFQLIGDLIRNKSIPNDCLNWSQTDVTRIFAAGKAAMMENGPWALPEIERAGIDYGICAFPVHNGRNVVIGGENLAVMAGKNVEGAVAFMDFYNQEDIMEEMCALTGNISPIRSAAEEFCKENPEYQVFVQQMAEGISRNSIESWKNVCRILSDSLYQMFGSEQTAEEIGQKYIQKIAKE